VGLGGFAKSFLKEIIKRVQEGSRGFQGTGVQKNQYYIIFFFFFFFKPL
jgi:hypothetical protein